MDRLAHRLDAPATLVARLLLATLFVMAGLDAAMHFDAFSARLQADGVPVVATGAVFWFLLLAGLGMALGLATRLLALAMAGFSLVSGVIAYGDLAEATDLTFLLKNISLSGGYLMCALHGPGAWSLDAVFGRR